MNNTDDEITINQHCLAAPEFTKSCALPWQQEIIDSPANKRGHLGDPKKERADP